MRNHLTPVRMAIIKNIARESVEKREFSYTYTIGGNINLYGHFGEQDGGFFKNWNVELSHDPAVLLLGIYTEKTIIWKVTCTPMFIYNGQDMDAT